jgi:hypothetical protein
MREIKFPLRYQLVAISEPGSRGGPFTDTIQAEYGSSIEGTGIKGRGGMRLVVLGEQ